MTIMTTIADRLAQVVLRIQNAERAHGRTPGSVQLVAVSKTFGPEAVRAAYAAGQRAFGENYVQEALSKMTALASLPLQWHCIGPVQSNKSRWVAEHFDWVHTVASDKLAQRLSAQRPPEKGPLQVCIQVNIDAGPNKSGVAPHQALALAQTVARLPGLRLRGMMCIPEPAPDFAAATAVFKRAKALFDELNSTGLSMDTLSLGMSADLEAAIAAGSTLVRVGSAIFGARGGAATAAGASYS
ncbi:MAG: YggS family pyridoxal phosphate-dependent enzyme [Rhodoferax sp.]